MGRGDFGGGGDLLRVGKGEVVRYGIHKLLT